MSTGAAAANGIISIHAPREGSDILPRVPGGCQPGFLSTLPVRGATHHEEVQQIRNHISIHAPREGSDLLMVMGRNPSSRFLSTLPVRGATGRVTVAAVLPHLFLSTLPVRGATPETGLCAAVVGISIHAPREGSDRPSLHKTVDVAGFLSTLPVRGATSACCFWISVKALFLSTLPVRGATALHAQDRGLQTDFYPRSP